MSELGLIAESEACTVVAEYEPAPRVAEGWQSEAELEEALVGRLAAQGYEPVAIRDEAALAANLRRQLEALNGIVFSDGEWERFFRECLAREGEGITEKTARLQHSPVEVLRRDDGSFKNVTLLDKRRIHNNRLQVMRQYAETGGVHAARYDVTILVNGLPMAQIELKRRGVALREAFNQINRYQRESFWAGCGLFEYVQLFVISNGTHTKYYSNTTRWRAIRVQGGRRGARGKKSCDSFEFTSFWADGRNRVIADLEDFARTFFAKQTFLSVLTRYCVLTAETEPSLLVMRPYQIAATEAILRRIATSSAYKQMGTPAAGGYVWHTTGSGKTLTSFKTAQLAAAMEGLDKVLFVVDRKDLDYQTIKEYDRFEKGAANGNDSTAVLQRQLEDGRARIIVTTIQKLSLFVKRNKAHPIYRKHVVIIFDECHRSQFGEMHTAIAKRFLNYHLFGFTGTPIFAANATSGGVPTFRTTEQVFGERLHAYTIVDAIRDGNVLPFRIDTVRTFRPKEDVLDIQVSAIDTERALLAPERIAGVTRYILDHFGQKTKRGHAYVFKGRRVDGFNSIFAVASIEAAKRYYVEFRRQLSEAGYPLRVATIFSWTPNEEEPDEDFDAEGLDASSRAFLESAIGDYNAAFGTDFDTSAEKFQNYYKDLSRRVKDREVDLLIVVNMFLTGFDATTLNTLWVDKNLRMHGLLQAFSRTNRILNSVKAYGNIVTFRDLQEETNEALALFGDKDARSVVLLRPYADYLNGYDDGTHHPGYLECISLLRERFPVGEPIVGEEAQKAFIRLFGALLRLRNILSAFDAFEEDDPLSPRDLQDWQSAYIDLWQARGKKASSEKADVNDDIVFEMELVRQEEIDIDDILALVKCYHAGNRQDKALRLSISKAIDSSTRLRSKKALIEAFAETVCGGETAEVWHAFVKERRNEELEAIIREEHLNPEQTRAFMATAFRDDVLKTSGTDLPALLPKISRFNPAREAKKATVIRRLQAFFDRFRGLLN